MNIGSEAKEAARNFAGVGSDSRRLLRICG
jgi:hypothetical protein